MSVPNGSPWKELLRTERIRRNWRQHELAEQLGIAVLTVQRWERGSHQPSAFFRVKLCALFGKSAEELGFVVENIPSNDLETNSLVETLPSSTYFPSLWNVPYSRNPFFTGREETLVSLHERLNRQHTMAPTESWAVTGLGGIGKTQIALEYAYRYRQDYHAVIWTSAATQESLLTGVFAIATLLQLPEQNEPDQTKVLQAVKLWFATHERWLWILDNADDITMIHEFVPMERPGHLLLTSRAQALGGVAQQIEIETMELNEGTLFLLRRARRLTSNTSLNQIEKEERSAAEAIVLAMDFLPLALDQAGAYIEESGCGFATYLDLYQKRRKDLLHYRGSMPTDYPRSVATTWSLSFQKVEQANAAAADLLRLCAFLHPDAIPEELFVVGAPYLGAVLGPVVSDSYQFDLALATLRSASLLVRLSETRTLSVHRLVQTVLRDQVGPTDISLWSERIVCMVNAAFPDGAFDTWAQCERYLPQALACVPLIEHASGTLLEAGELLYKAGSYLLERGQFGEAESLLERAVALGEQKQGTDHPALLPWLEKQAELFWKQGRYGNCEPLIQRILALRQHHLGLDHPQIAETLNNLALLYWHQGKYEQAEPLYEQALALGERHLGLDHLQVADTLNNLALLYRTQGKYEQAVPLHRRALSIYEQQGGPEHPLAARALNNLGVLYDDQEKYELSEPLFQRALRIWEQHLGSEHPQTALALNNLAFAYRAQGKYEQAEPLYQRALILREQSLGTDHPLTAGTLTGLGTLYREQGKYEQAEPLYQRALIICEQRLGPEHSQTADTLYHLATLYRIQRKYEQAEPLYRRALVISEIGLGSVHPQTVKIGNDYAQFLKIEEEHNAPVE